MDSLGLLSQDHRELLDGIDRLRSGGINNYVDLPEIIVRGDQSSGKMLTGQIGVLKLKGWWKNERSEYSAARGALSPLPNASPA